MAETWQICAVDVAPGNGKSMLGIFNGVGTSKVIRVYRIWFLNNYTKAAYTGVLVQFGIYLIGGLAVGSGAAVTPVKHDTNSASLDVNVGIFTGGTVSSEGNLLRLIAWSHDEPAVATGSSDEMETLVPVGEVWNTGYSDTRLQPLTLRSGEGVHVKCLTNTTVGSLDFCMEFTQSSS